MSDTKCPPGWKAFGSSCFLISSTRDTWIGAQTQCRNAVPSPSRRFSKLRSKLGDTFPRAELASISDGYEQAMLNWMAEQLFPKDPDAFHPHTPLEGSFWIGLNSFKVLRSIDLPLNRLLIDPFV